MSFDWKCIEDGSIVAKNGNVYEVGGFEKDYRLLRNKSTGNITRVYLGVTEDRGWTLLVQKSV